MCWFLIHVASTTTYIYHQFNAFLKSIFKVQYITMCNQLCNNINYIKEQNIYGIGNYYIEIHISMNTKEIKMISATVMIYYRFFRQIYNSYFLSTNVLFFFCFLLVVVVSVSLNSCIEIFFNKFESNIRNTSVF